MAGTRELRHLPGVDHDPVLTEIMWYLILNQRFHHRWQKGISAWRFSVLIRAMDVVGDASVQRGFGRLVGCFAGRKSDPRCARRPLNNLMGKVLLYLMHCRKRRDEEAKSTVTNVTDRPCFKPNRTVGTRLAESEDSGKFWFGAVVGLRCRNVNCVSRWHFAKIGASNLGY